jgi:hypothetical protein
MATGKYGVPKLSDSNYFTWKVRMGDYLTIKDCADAIFDANHAQSAKALAFIRSNVEDQYLSIIRQLDNAQEAWDALEAVFQQRSSASLLHLMRDLSKLKMEASESVSAYIGRARTLLNQLSAAGSDLEEGDIVPNVMSGLPAEYSMLVTVLENNDVAPTLNDLLAKALVVEQKNKVGSGETFRATAFKAAVFGGKCWKCGERGHLQRYCRSNSQPKRKVNVDYVLALCACRACSVCYQQPLEQLAVL